MQLDQATKSNKSGHYDYLKRQLDGPVAERTQAHYGDDGEVPIRELVALALIPCSKISHDVANVTISMPKIFSSKGACVDDYDMIFAACSTKSDPKIEGTTAVITNPKLKSALDMMDVIPRIYDDIDLDFGAAYNQHSPGYGRINAVKMYQEGKYIRGGENPTYLASRPKTKFYGEDATYKNPEGFLMPAVASMRALMDFDDEGNLTWVVEDPRAFMKENLPKIMSYLVSAISTAQSNPQAVGKSKGAYEMAEAAVKFLLREEELKQAR